MDELINLTDDELNFRAAKALGWEEIAGSQGQRLWRNGDNVMPKVAWIPTSNIYQAFQLQDEVAKRGLEAAFIDAMIDQASERGWTWFAITAAARTRTIAAVYVLEGVK